MKTPLGQEAIAQQPIFMRRRLAIAALVTGMVLSLLAAVPATAHASFVTWALCLRYNTTQCLNLKGGVEQQGQPIQLWNINTAGTPSQFEVENEGTVTDTGAHPWPFTPGSTLNTEFNGDPVIIIVYAPGGNLSDYCVGVQTDSYNVLSLDNGCYLSPPISLFVRTSATTWVNVYAEDQPSMGVLWTQGTGNGQTVISEAPNGFYNWEVFIVTWS